MLRRSPLPRRRAPLARGQALQSSAPKPRRQRDTGPSRDVRTLVWARDGGCCVVCGQPAAARWCGWSLHHRLPRGRGGANGPEWLLLLCGSGTTGCHGLVESRRTDAYAMGWLLRTGNPPGTPVAYADGLLYVLHADGERSAYAPRSDALPRMSENPGHGSEMVQRSPQKAEAAGTGIPTAPLPPTSSRPKEGPR